MTKQEWDQLGIVQKLQEVSETILMDDRYRDAIDEARDLLVQAGWGNPIMVDEREQP